MMIKKKHVVAKIYALKVGRLLTSLSFSNHHKKMQSRETSHSVKTNQLVGFSKEALSELVV
jgi:hypothetical protein